jgi:hypothetical protein
VPCAPASRLAHAPPACNAASACPAAQLAQIKRVDERIDKVKEELRLAKKEANGGSSARVDAKARQLDKMEADKRTKIELKNVALGTSRINYNDPRITVAWCKAMDVPITKPFNKSLLSKFTWAMSTAPGWRFYHRAGGAPSGCVALPLPLSLFLLLCSPLSPLPLSLPLSTRLLCRCVLCGFGQPSSPLSGGQRGARNRSGTLSQAPLDGDSSAPDDDDE